MENENESLQSKVLGRVEKERRRQEKADASDAEGQKKHQRFVQDCLRFNEMGDGVLFVHLNGHSFVFNKSSGEWLTWQGHHWEIDVGETAISAVESVAEAYDEEALKVGEKITWAIKKGDQDAEESLRERQKALFKRATKLRSDRGRRNCLAFARTNSMRSLHIMGEQIDRRPYLLACKNGVVDLRTGDLRPGRPDDFLMRSSPVEYHGIETPAPIWAAFLEGIFEDHTLCPERKRPQGELLQEYVQRLLGYAATGLTVEPVVPILLGQGRNGKSTLVETISYVMGDLAGPIPSEMLLDAGRFTNSNAPTPDIMDLRGLRIAFASEIEENRRFSASRLKWLSGSDSLVGRSPHDKHCTRFAPTHTLVLLSNHEPGAPMNDPAFWERIHLVPFKYAFVDRPPKTDFEKRSDKMLAAKLREEAPGILAWLVRGCLAWQEQGLCPPEKVKRATAEYRRGEDLLADFLEEKCFLDAGCREQTTPLYDAFKDWWTDNVSKKPLSHKKFGEMMTRRFEKRKIDGVNFYFGLRILVK